MSKSVIIGKVYDGVELDKLMGEDIDPYLYVIGNGTDAIVAMDVGNDNYRVLGVLRLDSQPQGVQIYLKEEVSS